MLHFLFYLKIALIINMNVCGIEKILYHVSIVLVSHIHLEELNVHYCGWLIFLLVNNIDFLYLYKEK